MNPLKFHQPTWTGKQKLEKAPVHNLAAEYSVGFVNYELIRTGAKQLASISSAQVKPSQQI